MNKKYFYLVAVFLVSLEPMSIAQPYPYVGPISDAEVDSVLQNLQIEGWSVERLDQMSIALSFREFKEINRWFSWNREGTLENIRHTQWAIWHYRSELLEAARAASEPASGQPAPSSAAAAAAADDAECVAFGPENRPEPAPEVPGSTAADDGERLAFGPENRPESAPEVPGSAAAAAADPYAAADAEAAKNRQERQELFRIASACGLQYVIKRSMNMVALGTEDPLASYKRFDFVMMWVTLHQEKGTFAGHNMRPSWRRLLDAWESLLALVLRPTLSIDLPEFSYELHCRLERLLQALEEDERQKEQNPLELALPSLVGGVFRGQHEGGERGQIEKLAWNIENADDLRCLRDWVKKRKDEVTFADTDARQLWESILALLDKENLQPVEIQVLKSKLLRLVQMNWHLVNLNRVYAYAAW